jgi:acyl-coenzyme A thioesterase PaaI-like protein
LGAPHTSIGGRLERAWRRLSRLPGGRRVFARMLGRMVPYSGSIRPHVIELEPGRALVALEERRALRNHFRSVHAIALANLGELASGLAMTLALPAGVRGIPIRIEVDYLKKARGRIVADGRATPPAIIGDATDATATAELRDEANDVVARLVVRWRLSPEPH